MSSIVMAAERVSVGYLAELGRGGDINFRFSNRSSAIEGIRGHQRVQKSRGKRYLSEYRVEQAVVADCGDIIVSGRVDGISFDEVLDLFVVEEIKTIRVAVEEIPDSVLAIYWRQVMLYAYLIALEHGRDELCVQLCFYHLDDKTQTLLKRQMTYSELALEFAQALFLFSELRRDEQHWVGKRTASLQDLPFPYGDYRTGQRDMAVSVFRTISEQSELVLQAPTGIGKTMATIYPALRALDPEIARRVFYVSARTSTQALALDAARDIGSAGGRIRTVVITAKDKICFNPGQPCHPDHCEYARGYYDNLHGTIAALVDEHECFDRDTIESVAREHTLCPFELGLDLASVTDLVIADYNYVFDPVVHLRRFFDGDRRDSIVLIDEAHNLVDRGREMFSAEVTKASYLTLATQLKSVRPRVAAKLRSANRAILTFRNQDKTGFEREGYVVSHHKPEALLKALEAFCVVAEEELREDKGLLEAENLLQCYFDSLRFVRTAEQFDGSYRTLLVNQAGGVRVKLYCVDPATQLKAVFAGLAAAVCFSATLNPSGYFRRLLGTSQDAKWYRLPSPFPRENLGVSIASYIDTSYRGRNDSVESLAQLIEIVIKSAAGNYLVFFPSHEYLQMTYDWFSALFPDINIMPQARTMSDEERKDFLDAFDGQGVCGFAVMGGIFSEGVDLKGEKLIGVIVVGVGLPQMGIERDLIRNHFPEDGFAYAYQYPGMTKVLQTAGRVIRDETDRGIVCLVDSRYTQSRYQDLLPEHWDVHDAKSPIALQAQLNQFWLPRDQGTIKT